MITMSEIQEITPIEKHELVGVAAQLFAEGYRFVQVGCATLESSYELTYCFDKAYRLKNYRITLLPDEDVASISVIYPNAFLYENELHDLFGVSVRNISIDYHGTLYRTSIKTPFSIGNVKGPVPPQPKPEATKENTESVKEQAAAPEEQPTG
jgi:ech hydrogenase subunit D